MLTPEERKALEAAPAQAAKECLTLLKNDNNVLPISSAGKSSSLVLQRIH